MIRHNLSSPPRRGLKLEAMTLNEIELIKQYTEWLQTVWSKQIYIPFSNQAPAAFRRYMEEQQLMPAKEGDRDERRFGDYESDLAVRCPNCGSTDVMMPDGGFHERDKCLECGTRFL